MSASFPRIDVIPLGFVEHRVSRRDRVLDLVLRGRLTPERAEAWARDNGEPAFAEEPDPSRFDPMAEVDWTFAMAAAWMLRRTPDTVRRAWDAFLAECWQWRLVDMIVPRAGSPTGCRRLCGHQLDQPEVPSAASTLERSAAIGASLVMPADEVEREMRHALRSGRLAAFARGAVDPIPARLWADVSPFTRPVRRGRHDAVYGGNGTLLFAGVKTEREAVIALWPTAVLSPVVVKPGRRSLRALWWSEFERREAQGQAPGHLATAKALHAWLQAEVDAGRVSLPDAMPMPPVATLESTIQTHRAARKRVLP